MKFEYSLFIDTDSGSSNLRKLTRMVSSDIAPKMLDPSLHTVTEEDDDESGIATTSFRHSLTVTGVEGVASDISSLEDEILSMLITLLFEFLSKETKPKVDPELGSTDSEQVRDIVNYFGLAMGFEPSTPWKVNKAMNMKRFRYVSKRSK